MEIRTERRVVVAAGTTDVWAAVIAIDRYPHRWPWLRELEWRGGFVAGAGCRCRVRAPLGYSVRFGVVLDAVEPGRRVEATVDGDVAGTAGLTLVPVDGLATELRLVTVLRPERRLLRALGRASPALARRGHDRIVESGMERFAADVV